MTKQDFEFFAKFAVDYSLPDEAITELLELFKNVTTNSLGKCGGLVITN